MAYGAGQILGAGSMDAGSRDHPPDVLHEYVEAAVIAGLLVFNAALGFFQEGRAQATLAALKSRLALTASVRRDGAWKNIPATELVPGDTVKLSLGGVVAADVKLVEGSILLDQSMLTGESVPIEAGPGLQTYAGALVRRGEATAIVTATGQNEVWTHRGTRPHRPCREHPAKDRRAGGAQSCHLQRRNHRLAGGVRPCP
jgi:magnesium-transporting ATPase (P-type)